MQQRNLKVGGWVGRGCASKAHGHDKNPCRPRHLLVSHQMSFHILKIVLLIGLVVQTLGRLPVQCTEGKHRSHPPLEECYQRKRSEPGQRWSTEPVNLGNSMKCDLGLYLHVLFFLFLFDSLFIGLLVCLFVCLISFCLFDWLFDSLFVWFFLCFIFCLYVCFIFVYLFVYLYKVFPSDVRNPKFIWHFCAFTLYTSK